MQIPLQEKIAELEQRIEKLEKKQSVRSATLFDSSNHWKNMWHEFDLLMKELFQ